ncbi:hypothetical protein EVAR_16403_1 [Eumeta japonica]|uniref:Uncharacterized protein n=1 Tax=Eumeta variegata TaxID=151549 RepID=A0A4C1VWU0_EUMVA|nr:hypothetical protein EVAR_16403_1 [Eumeta japonica]
MLGYADDAEPGAGYLGHSFLEHAKGEATFEPRETRSGPKAAIDADLGATAVVYLGVGAMSSIRPSCLVSQMRVRVPLNTERGRGLIPKCTSFDSDRKVDSYNRGEVVGESRALIYSRERANVSRQKFVKGCLPPPRPRSSPAPPDRTPVD